METWIPNEKNYRTISVSIRVEDLEQLDRAVDALRELEPHPRRRAGDAQMSRSKLIRLLIQMLNLDALVRETPAGSAAPSGSPRERAARRTTSRQARRELLAIAARTPALAELLM